MMRWKGSGREPHPAMWWLWAVIVATMVVTTEQDPFARLAVPIVICVTLAFILIRARLDTNRRRIIRLALLASAFFLAFRLVIAIVIGVPMPGTALFNLPQIELPKFLVGITVGGPVTVERILSVIIETITFATIIMIFASAGALTTPLRVLRAVPARFYGFGLAMAMATSIAPRTALSVARVRLAQELRGNSENSFQQMRRVAIPVLEESLERSIELAQSLESRGYGMHTPSRYRRERWGAEESLVVGGAVIALLFLRFSGAAPILTTIIIFAALQVSVILT